MEGLVFCTVYTNENTSTYIDFFNGGVRFFVMEPAHPDSNPKLDTRAFIFLDLFRVFR